MRHYLEQIKITNTPETWSQDDERKWDWDMQREKYGFDERETWSLDYTFYLWLYERLKMYLEVACVDLDAYKFEYKDHEYTQKQLIDLVLSRLEEYFKNDCSYTENTLEIGEIWAKLLPVMWW